MKKSSATTKAQVAVDIKALQKQSMTVDLFGTSPLITNAWSQKAKLEMLQKHMQIPIVREVKDPYKVFLNSIWRTEDNQYGFPVVGVKEAMATAALDLEGITKAQIYRNIFLTGKRGFQVAAFADLMTPHDLAELFSPNAPKMREDMVRLSGIQRTPDLRYRAEFWPWSLRVNISYLSDFITPNSILNLLQHAGFRVGLGEWRQDKGGVNGSFRVAMEEDQAQIDRWMKQGQKEPKPVDVDAWVKKIRAAQPVSAEKVVKAPKAKRPNGKGVEAH